MNKTCMAELVSMIIPVYNTPEQFLDECLDSVRKQSYKELEVILVDDGSDSKTAAYLDTIAGKDFVVLHKENGGSAQPGITGYSTQTGSIFVLWIRMT